ncbi:hypothetical protein JTB14_035586 [Gonioctena quinquepunctata]|nr:hypothetical protein JTB14_035586 [Gonioctena quinquepunctata]
MKKIQSTTVCQEGVEDVMNNVLPVLQISLIFHQCPYFIRDPPILPTLEGEENWDADNYTTYTPNRERDIIRQPLIGKSKKEKRKFRRRAITTKQIEGTKKWKNKI